MYVAHQHHASVVQGAAVGNFVAHLPSPQLLACSTDCLTLWAPAAGSGLVEQVSRIPLFDVVDAVVAIPQPGAGSVDCVLLLSSDAARVTLARLVARASNPKADQPSTLVTCQELCTTYLARPSYPSASKRITGPCCSRLHMLHASPTHVTCLLGLAVYLDHVHVLRVEARLGDNGKPGTAGAAGSSSAAHQDVTHSMDNAIADVCHSTSVGSAAGSCLVPHAHLRHVLAMELLPSTDPLGAQRGSLLLGLLLHVSGAGYSSTQLESLELCVDSAAQLQAQGPAAPRPGSRTTPHPADMGSSGAIPGAGGMQLLGGPWSCRQLEPSTSVLCALPATATLPAGLLAVSSCGLLLVSGAAGVPATGLPAVQQQVVLEYRMAGRPTCCEVLPADLAGAGAGAQGQLLLVGDSLAGLHVLRVGGASGSAYLQVHVQGGPVAPPSLLRCMCVPAGPTHSSPTHSSDSSSSSSSSSIQHLVFLGSDTFNSQLLAVRPTQPPSASGEAATGNPAAAADVLSLQLVDAALVKSLAPVHSCVAVPDAQAAGQAGLLLGCGTAPWGRLARAKLGVALCPYFPAPMTLPGEGVQLFPLQAPPDRSSCALGAHPRTTHVAFSFSASCSSQVLSLEGDTFCPVQLPGLQQQAECLHLACVGPHAAGLVQVVPQEVRLCAALPEATLLATWRPPAPQQGTRPAPHITLAAAAHDVTAVCTGSTVYSLRLQPAAGAAGITLLSSQELSQPMSSLSVACGAAYALGEAPGVYVLWGDWLQGRCVVCRADDLRTPLLQVDLGGHIARSACLLPAQVPGHEHLPASSRWVLAVGTNSGAVLLWELQQPQQPQLGAASSGPAPSSGWAVAEQLVVQVSNVAVQLRLVDPAAGQGPSHQQQQPPGSAPYLHAHSGQDAIICVSPAAAVQQQAGVAGAPPRVPLRALLSVQSVHGSTWLQACCPLPCAPSMPHPDSWVWVTASSQLMFGRLDRECKLRWTTALIGDTPHHVAHHSCSGCYVVLTADASGQQALRLVHGDSLQPLVSLRLADEHHYTSLMVAHLPCTSSSSSSSGPSGAPGSSAAAAAGGSIRAGLQAHGHKEFVVLASHMYSSSSSSSHPLVGSRPGGPSSSAGRGHPGRATQAHAASQQTQGLLSFFEVVVHHAPTAQAPAADSAAAGNHAGPGPGAGPQHPQLQYKLLLHGVAPVPAGVPLSLATAVPALATGPTAQVDTPTTQAALLTKKQPAAQQQGIAADSATQPHLLVGCQAGVHAYQVVVDDAARQGADAAAALLAAAAAGPADTSWVPPPPGLFTDPSAGNMDEEEDEELTELVLEQYGRARRLGMDGLSDDEDRPTGSQGPAHDQMVRDMQALLRRNWSQHVRLTKVSSAQTLAGFAATQLHTHGSLILASDFMASVTVMQLQQQPPPPSKQRAARGATSAAAATQALGVGLAVLAADHLPIYAPAALLLDEQRMLLSVHPHGVAMMQRDPAAEAQAAAQHERQASGSQQPHALPDVQGLGWQPQEQPPAAPPALPSLAGLDVLVACNLRHPITHMLPYPLGLQLQDPSGQPLPMPLAAHSPFTHVTAVAADGAVLELSLAQPEHAASLQQAAQLQQALQQAQADLGCGLPQCARHSATWPLCVAPDNGLHALTAASGTCADAPCGRQLPCTTAIDMELLQAAAAHGSHVWDAGMWSVYS